MFRSTLVLLFLGVAQTLSANFIVNGSFESPYVGYEGADQFSAIPGWTAVVGHVELQNNITGLGLYPAYDGAQQLELDAIFNSHIEQVVSGLSAGFSYVLSLGYSPRPGYAANTNPVEVLWNNTVIATLVGDGTNLGNLTWQLFTLPVVAVAGDNVVGLRGVGISDGAGGLVDNVRLETPEPGTFALAGLAGVVVGLHRLRRRA